MPPANCHIWELISGSYTQVKPPDHYLLPADILIAIPQKTWAGTPELICPRVPELQELWDKKYLVLYSLFLYHLYWVWGNLLCNQEVTNTCVHFYEYGTTLHFLIF